jgi:hypothetical protein
LSKRKFPEQIPEYFTHLKPNSLLSAREVALLFGYKDSQTLNKSVYKNIFPRSDLSITTKNGIKKNYWRVETICRYILKHNNLG